MKKFIVMMAAAVLMAWASPLMAQTGPEGDLVAAPEVRIGGGNYGIKHTGDSIAGEYLYLKSSPAGELEFEWDPLPHRFVLESYYLNPKDYFGEIDYSYRDLVVFNGYTRGLFHNLNHVTFGTDNPITVTPSFTDLNPGDLYGIDNQLSRGFIRFKMPNFPLHLYANVRTIDREGTVQQRFLSTGGFNKISQSRIVDWNTSEYQVGLNSHLGPLEADYSHTEKRFEDDGAKVMRSPFLHNLVPEIESSWDTVKVHTNYSGRFVLAGTYTNGDRTNEDSTSKVEFANAAGDLMFMPVTSVIFSLRYRHYEQDATNPDTITITGLGTFSIRDSISSKRDSVSGVVRYRATERLTLKAEYVGDTIDRTRSVSTALPGTEDEYWALPSSTTKNTARIGFNYRFLKRVLFRGDYSATSVDNPAYATDPDKASNARVALIWTPSSRFNSMLSYGLAREKRDALTEPLAGGSRDATRDQGLASATVMIGKWTSFTASYGLYKNAVEQTVTLTDGATGLFVLEPAVPYDDTAHVATLALTVAPKDGVNLTGSATRSFSRGNFRLSGADGVTNVSDIAELTDLKVVDTVYGAGLEMQITRYVSTDVLYQHRTYDDKIDDEQDGTMQLVLATLSVKW
jgi:opacity protein-like surface antigen